MGQSADEVRRRAELGATGDRGESITVRPVNYGEGGNGATGSDDPAAIEAEIEQTRAEMSETIDAIQQRLSPEALTEQAKEKVEDLTEHAKEAAREAVNEAKEAVRVALLEARDNVREATIGRVETMVRNVGDTAYDTRDGLMDTVRQNPIPAALVGLGLGWLWMNRRSGSSRRSNARYEREYRERDYYRDRDYSRDYDYRGERGAYYPTGYGRGEYAGGQSQQGGNVVTQAAGRVGEAAGTVAGTAGNVVGAVGQTVGSVASTVGETASTLVSGTRETAGSLVGGVQHRAGRVEDSVGRALQENPLAVGAVALALGTAVGLALPQTQREHQLLGEARDTLVERAQELAQETFEKVQSVAGEAQQAAGQAVQQEAKAQGLTQ
jgi:hypothetical protein